MDYFMLLTAMFSRVNIQSSKKETLGLFAPDPNQGPEDPGPATGDIALLRKADKLRLVRWGDGKFEGFWPKKAREHPQEKVNFPLRMIPWLSPDALHLGWRRSPQAQSSQVRFMRTLLVSPDFIADEIPATGGHRRFIRRVRSTTALSQTSAFFPVSAGTKQILQFM